MTDREKFEAWAASEGFDLVRHSDETYATQECHDAWAGWQASRRAALEEAASYLDADRRHNSAAAIRALADGDQQ